MTDTDPLQDLLIDADEVDRARIAEALGAMVGVDGKTGAVVPRTMFKELTSKQKILAYLLGKKVAFLLEKTEKEPTPRKEIIDETGMPSGSVGRTLRELLENRLIYQDSNGEYYVARHQVETATQELEQAKAS